MRMYVWNGRERAGLLLLPTSPSLGATASQEYSIHSFIIIIVTTTIIIIIIITIIIISSAQLSSQFSTGRFTVGILRFGVDTLSIAFVTYHHHHHHHHNRHSSATFTATSTPMMSTVSRYSIRYSAKGEASITFRDGPRAPHEGRTRDLARNNGRHHC